jgi:23S rRNA (cytidine1920-2'-O)/16S rRNA (cytidine1409-2'-O)-methyltransferase
MKLRADLLLVKKNLVPSRQQAQSLILAGKVFCRTARIEKAGQLIEEEAELRVEEPLPFVSRGGVKLDHALNEFKIDVKGKICLDVGASTGGFTDCLLQRGAKKVYAVDVGYGQFDWKLREDPRVVLFEKSNFRHFDLEKIQDPIDLAVADVSFISLDKILPNLKKVLREGGEAAVMVKPQFELSPAEVKKGVVRSEVLREKAIAKIEAAAQKEGFKLAARADSPITGPKGNLECFLHLLTLGNRA